MNIDPIHISRLKAEVENHLTKKLLPFWLDRCLDEKQGGYVTHFDQYGKDTGTDEKSLISQARTIYTMSSAHRAGYGDGHCEKYARHGVDFLIGKLWDKTHGGFFWMADRAGKIIEDKKILYGQSFALYALSEYALATGDPTGRQLAEETFNLIQGNCADNNHGGYFEMFERDWTLCGPGKAGGDRKTLDVHFHLMEAFTPLYELTGDEPHKKALTEMVDLILSKFLHPVFGTGIPQFTMDWKVAPQIKFDIVWGCDRFGDQDKKAQAENNTSYGHNMEIVWLLLHALVILDIPWIDYQKPVEKLLEHTVRNGIDRKAGGVFVEGTHDGGPTDLEKEFWQQAEVMVGMLDGCLLFDDERYRLAYENVHRFVFDKFIDHQIGEWRPLLTREGVPIWTHLGHSWKTNYHTVRSMIQCIKRLDKLSSL